MEPPRGADSKVKPGPKFCPADGGHSIIVDPTKTDTFIAIELVDADKNPVPFEAFIVTPPGMAPISGTLDANGEARIEGINPGICTVELPKIDRRDFV